MNLQELKRQKSVTALLLIVKALVAGLSIQKATLAELGDIFQTNLPVTRWFFTLFQSMDGWGMEVFFVTAGFACMFYYLKEHPLRNNAWIRGLALFFSVCTVIGKSYYDLENLNYFFNSGLQFVLACLVIWGYYWIYKNVIILLKAAVDKWNLLGGEPKYKVEKWLFEKHPFFGPLLVIGICCIPVLIAFFPGTIQSDSYVAIYSYLGNPRFLPWTSQQPVAVTWLLGQCLYLSRVLFGNDNMMVFFYAGPQYVIQWLVFSYGMYVLNKLAVPRLLRGGALIYFSVFPMWQIWGYTVVKDSYYYIFSLLLVAILIHIFATGRVLWWQWLLLAVSSVAIAVTRNNGMPVLVLFCIAVLVFYRRYWKLCIVVAVSTFLALYVVEDIYMAEKGIQPGPVREVLSVPLQQTARYIKEHYADITEKEMEVLSSVFYVEPARLAELYNPELSDPVKEQFLLEPTGEELQAYFKIWFSQLRKHPATYVSAYLNHTYGYFYPNREEFHENIGRYYIGLGYLQSWADDYLQVGFSIKDRGFRDFFEQEAYLVSRLPLIGMLYSCGFHNYILIGCIIYLLANRRLKELIILVPSVLTVLVCLVSPVDAYLRYMLPVMACLPLNIAWCWYVTAKKNPEVCGMEKGDIVKNTCKSE